MGDSGSVSGGALAGIIEGSKLGKILEMCWRRRERRKNWVGVWHGGIAERRGTLFAEYGVAEQCGTPIFRYAVPDIRGDQARGIKIRDSNTEIGCQPK